MSDPSHLGVARAGSAAVYATLLVSWLAGCGGEPVGELAAAVEAGDRSAAIRLLADGADPNRIDGDGLTPLIRAVRRATSAW